MNSTQEFSFRTRQKSLQRFRGEIFDILVIGGGITGAAVARDAVSRGLNVALVERMDFAFGTSSRSSKLIHGGLRYLQNFEIKLVFEALSERTLLLKTIPHLVKPLPFFLPSYKGDSNGRMLLSAGLWLYDLLALFRSPGFHRSLSKKQLLKSIPFLRAEGLTGGFRFFDASMWDDVMAVETLRCAQENGAAVANYIEAIAPLWDADRIVGFKVRDLESYSKNNSEKNEWSLKARRVIVCAGPWTDQMGSRLVSSESQSGEVWNRWLTPSKGIHLVFDLKRIPLSGALMMSHPQDGRIAFVIPRPDYGAGIVLVGTTDGPADHDPERVVVEAQDVQYLLVLLQKYFPTLNLTEADIVSAYVGVRPLMGGEKSSSVGGNGRDSSVLQKVSREHHIDIGPGGTVVVAGGKYTTHRKMAEEIVDFTLENWKKDAHKYPDLTFPRKIGPSQTRSAVNPQALPEAIRQCRAEAEVKKVKIPEELISRYGADALSVFDLRSSYLQAPPVGFPDLEAQLRHCIRAEMVLHLEDFYLRRVPLYFSRKDHGLPWLESLAKVWAQERGLNEADVSSELTRLRAELDQRSAWQK